MSNTHFVAYTQFKFGESYLSNAVGEVGWPTYSSLAQNVKQEPGTSPQLLTVVYTARTRSGVTALSYYLLFMS